MDIIIRRAGIADIPELCRLENECFSLPWSEKAFVDFFGNGCSHCFVAVSDGTVCGYVGINLILGEGEVTNLAVAVAYRRLGIGEALIEALCGIEGMGRILLDVRESNTPARRLYEKCGFNTDGVRRGFYSRPREDAVLMSRTINKD